MGKSVADFAILLAIPLAAFLGLAVVAVVRVIRLWKENQISSQTVGGYSVHEVNHVRLRMSLMPNVRPLGLKRVSLRDVIDIPYIRPSRIRVHFKKSDLAKPVDGNN